MISAIAVRTSRDSAPSGATEKNFENLGSVKNRRMKSTATVLVL